MPIIVKVPKGEVFDEAEEKFHELDRDVTIVMEYSLLAISKWESKFHKPYLTKDTKTEEEALYFLRCMTINKDVPDIAYQLIPKEELINIRDYINDPMTGTTIKDPPKRASQREEVQSAELLYYYMFKLNIPKECERWHLNRLTTLFRVFGVKDAPKEKLSRSEMIARNKAINAKNRARFNTKG